MKILTIFSVLTIKFFCLFQISPLSPQLASRRIHTPIYFKINTLYQETADRLGITPYLYPKHKDAIIHFLTRAYNVLSQLGKSKTEIEKFVTKSVEILLSIARLDRERILEAEPFSLTIKPKFESFIHSVYKTLSQLIPPEYLPRYEEISERITFSSFSGIQSISYTDIALGVIILDLGRALQTPLIPQKGIASTIEYALVHELLHLLSYPTFDFLWDEGVATYFSRKWTGYTGGGSLEYKTVKELAGKIGERDLLNSYLSGDFTSLREKLGPNLVRFFELSSIFRTYIIIAKNKELYRHYCKEIVESCSDFLSQDFISELRKSRDPISILIWELHDNPQALEAIKQKIKTAILETEFHSQRNPPSR